MKKRILIIDDEAQISDLLKEMLTREGYLVTTAASGTEAKWKVKEEAPNLIISDLQMEDTDGLSLIAEIRESIPNTPVILLTGMIFDAETILETINKKGIVYIAKTDSLQKIRSEVKRMLA